MFEIIEHIIIDEFIGHLDFYVIMCLICFFLGNVFFRN